MIKMVEIGTIQEEKKVRSLIGRREQRKRGVKKSSRSIIKKLEIEADSSDSE